MPAADVSDYRLSPRLVTRMLGSYLVALGLLVVVAAVVVAATGAPGILVAGLFGLGLAGLLVLLWWLRTRAYVVRFGPDGYRTGLLRGAGVRQATWKDVTTAGATSHGGAPCLELRLRSGEATVIPVAALAVERDDFVRDVRERLQRGHGLRPL